MFYMYSYLLTRMNRLTYVCSCRMATGRSALAKWCETNPLLEL